jgi:hypothetical protein
MPHGYESFANATLSFDSLHDSISAEKVGGIFKYNNAVGYLSDES